MVIGPSFVFLAVPRTASQSLTYHWLPHYGGVSLGPDHYHRQDVPAEHQSKFTFAVVRNPYDRWMSLWYLMQKISLEEKFNLGIRRALAPSEFVNWCRIAAPKMPNWLAQHQFLSEARIDSVVKYENLRVQLQSLPFVDVWHEPPVEPGAMNRRPLHMDMNRDFVQAVNTYSLETFRRFQYEIL